MTVVRYLHARWIYVSLLALISTTAHAGGPFGGSRLFVNQSVRHEMERTFGVGVKFTIAPVKAAQKALVKKFKSEYPEESAAVLQAAEYIPASELERLSQDPNGVREKLMAVPSLSPDQKLQIDTVFDTVESQGAAIGYVDELLRIMQEPDTAITFSLEPYAEFHFKYLDVALVVPMAGFVEDSTEFAMGNIGVDLKFGETWGDTFAFGLTGGVQVWTPTATERANSLGLANLQWSPRYFHEYMTVTPYLALGADLSYVQFQASLSYNAMEQVKGNPDFDQVHFMQWGASFAVTAVPHLVISAELSGLIDIINAAAYDNLVITAGVRTVFSFMDIGLGCQVPLIQQDGSSYASLNSVSFGGPSSYNVILDAVFGF